MRGAPRSCVSFIPRLGAPSVVVLRTQWIAEDVIKTTKHAAAETLEYRGFLSEELDDLWATLGDDYFLRERADDIAWHTEAIADHNHDNGALVLVRQASESPVSNATQIFVHTQDQPNTFARICAAIETLDLSIHDARIYSDTNGGTLDTFFVLKSDGSSLSSHPDTFAEIEEKIRHSLALEGLKTVSRHTPRTVRAFTIPTSVAFSEDEAGVHTTSKYPPLTARACWRGWAQSYRSIRSLFKAQKFRHWESAWKMCSS